jgi:carbohydrate kinase (thermoresistant glucokinase family)
MGVAGSGKTTIGRVLSEHLGLSFHDGDDFHSPGNIKKMTSGEALTDEDRDGWLSTLSHLIKDKEDVVLACSALKRSYRDRLRESDSSLLFVFLDVSVEIAKDRLRARGDHFMPASLIISQFSALERPRDAIRIDAEQPVAAVVRDLKGRLERSR